MIPSDLEPIIRQLIGYSFGEVTEFKYLSKAEQIIIKDEETFFRLRELAGLNFAKDFKAEQISKLCHVLDRFGVRLCYNKDEGVTSYAGFPELNEMVDCKKCIALTKSPTGWVGALVLGDEP